MAPMGELVPTGTSAVSSQGVDLFELERLRVLVRFDFERELTRDELVVALTRCHNNTREAYHFLKEQRRQAQLSEAAQMVAAAAATASVHAVQNATTSHATVSVNETSSSNGGAKRRSESDTADDSDVKMDTPNKRHRSFADATTVDLSQDDASMTQATQQSDSDDQHTARFVDHDRASRIIADVVGKLSQSAHLTSDDAQWLSAAVEALAVQHLQELDSQLAVVVESLATALKQVSASDVPEVQRDGVKQIMDVLVQLPRQDQYDVELRLKPSDEVLDKKLAEVEAVFACALGDDLSKNQRAQAARNAITVIATACSLCVDRQQSILDSVKAAQVHRRRVRTRVSDLKNTLQSHLEKAGSDVKTSEKELDQVRANQSRLTVALMGVVKHQKAILIDQGMDEDDATLDAHKAVVLSTDTAIVRLRQEREENQRLCEARKEDVMRANAHLEFFQKLDALRQKTVPAVQQWLEMSAKRVDLLKTAAERDVDAKLNVYVPKMAQALHLCYDFHTMRQQLATKDREKQKESLTDHLEFYGDLVPSTRKEIENKISEFNGVIVQSTQVMREVANMQCELWEGKRKLFSPAVFAIVEHEYGRLWKALSGGAKDMMLDCVRTIRDQPDVQPTVSSPSLTADTATANRTVAPFQFVGREHDWRRPTVVPGAPSVLTATASPLVDLTEDDDGDDAMNGDMDASSIAPSTQIMRFTEGNGVDSVGFTVFKTDERNEVDIPTPVRDFPMGARLCWMLTDEQGEMDGLFSGHVKDRTAGGSYVLEDDAGNEHTIPVQGLFTQEEMETYSREQNGSVQDHSNREGCAIM